MLLNLRVRLVLRVLDMGPVAEVLELQELQRLHLQVGMVLLVLLLYGSIHNALCNY